MSGRISDQLDHWVEVARQAVAKVKPGEANAEIHTEALQALIESALELRGMVAGSTDAIPERVRVDLADLDQQLENALGGFWLSAPVGDPIGRARERLRLLIGSVESTNPRGDSAAHWRGIAISCARALAEEGYDPIDGLSRDDAAMLREALGPGPKASEQAPGAVCGNCEHLASEHETDAAGGLRQCLKTGHNDCACNQYREPESSGGATKGGGSE